LISHDRKKRVFDVLVAGFAIITLFIPIIALAIIIRLQMGSPVLFTQERAGKHGDPFVLYKFRSMTNETDENGELLPDEERITKLGGFLRQTTLDELPELINVLKGNMSLVGPRPLRVSYNDLYSDYQSQRLDVKPGLTSWAVVKGRNALSWNRRFEYDVWYVQNRSFTLDIKILFMTVALILRRDGVSHESHATMPPFTGNEDD